MRVLLDSCVPQGFRHALPGHTVESARYAGLDGLLNGLLLQAMEGRFDVLITCDQGLQWQQSMTGRSIAVLLLIVPSNRLPDLLPLAPSVLVALDEVDPGELRVIGP